MGACRPPGRHPRRVHGEHRERGDTAGRAPARDRGDGLRRQGATRKTPTGNGVHLLDLGENRFRSGRRGGVDGWSSRRCTLIERAGDPRRGRIPDCTQRKRRGGRPVRLERRHLRTGRRAPVRGRGHDGRHRPGLFLRAGGYDLRRQSDARPADEGREPRRVPNETQGGQSGRHQLARTPPEDDLYVHDLGRSRGREQLLGHDVLADAARTAGADGVLADRGSARRSRPTVPIVPVGENTSNCSYSTIGSTAIRTGCPTDPKRRCSARNSSRG